MKMLCKLVVMSGLLTASAVPAMAQQGQMQMPMMGQGGMMGGQGMPGGMMGRAKAA